MNLLCSVAVFCAVASADHPRLIREYTATGVPYLGLEFPKAALTESDIERWGDFLGASEAQLNFMRALYVRFVDDHNALMDRKAPAHLAQCAEAYEVMERTGMDSDAFVSARRALDRSTTEFRRELVRIEHDFIDSLEPILTPDQAESLTILRLETSRRYCRVHSPWGPWVTVELRDVWDRTAASLAGPAEATQVSAIFGDYEPRLTSLVCRHTEGHEETRRRLEENRVAWRDGKITTEERAARVAQFSRAYAAIGREIRTLNVRTTGLIVEAVSEKTAKAFLTDAKRAAFPHIYPDPTALHDLFAAIAEDDALDADERTAAVSLFDGYAAQYDRLCAKLEDFCTDFGDRNAEGVNGYQRQFLPQALEPLLQERTELSIKILSQCEELLGPAALERHTALIPRIHVRTNGVVESHRE